MLTGNLPLHIYKASREKPPILIDHVHTSENIFQNHTNYFSVLWVRSGKGIIETDFSKTTYDSNQVFCFNNYQAFALYPSLETKALLLYFHPNFFCIETYQHEVGCNGVLFNQVFEISSIIILEEAEQELLALLENMKQELSKNEMATGELIFSYLKIYLVKLTRMKTASAPLANSSKSIPAPLEKLMLLVNENFATEHKPSFYANSLYLSVKSLSNRCQKYFNKSLSALITEKLLLKSKWELLHTDKPVKQVADALGFKDEYYFSRFFKKHIGLSPKSFRQSEWGIRKGFLSIP
jgi:AraC family transcriptional regulator, transcriptional activator of pobA